MPARCSAGCEAAWATGEGSLRAQLKRFAEEQGVEI